MINWLTRKLKYTLKGNCWSPIEIPNTLELHWIEHSLIKSKISWMEVFQWWRPHWSHFFAKEEFIHKKLVFADQTVNTVFYQEILQRLSQWIQIVMPQMTDLGNFWYVPMTIHYKHICKSIFVLEWRHCIGPPILRWSLFQLTFFLFSGFNMILKESRGQKIYDDHFMIKKY